MQSFGWSLLYKAHLTSISPILFITFLSLVPARRLSSACSVISPTNSPFMVLHAPLDNANQIFSQSRFSCLLILSLIATPCPSQHTFYITHISFPIQPC